MANSRIYQQIETAAGRWAPWVYRVLSYGNQGFEPQDDPLTLNYIPLTTANIRQRNQLIPFIIGLIPPSAIVTGRLLDRSASLRVTAGTNDALDVQQETSGPGMGTRTPFYVKTLPQEFYNAFVAMCKRLGLDPWSVVRVMINESQMDPTNMNPTPPGAKGLIQFTWDGAQTVMSRAVFDKFETLSAIEQLPYVEAALKRTTKPGATRGEIYRAVFLPSVTPGPDGELCHMGGPYYGSNAGPKFDGWGLDVNKDGKVTIDDLAEKSNFKLPADLERKLLTALGQDPSVVVDTKGQPSNWSTTGSTDSSTAKKAIKTKADRDLNVSDLGKRLTAAQAAQSKALADAIQRMADTPPLQLLVNPTSFKVAGSKIINDGNFGRNGPIVQHWGDDHDKIDVSGKIAGFYALDVGNAGGPGLTRMARSFSESYQNFLSLYLIYRNNGGIWLDSYEDANLSKPNNLTVVGSVYIYYDGVLYIGSFDNFTISETDTAPFTLEYSFSFTVRASFALDQVGNGNPNPAADYGLNSGLSLGTTTYPNLSLSRGDQAELKAQEVEISAQEASDYADFLKATEQTQGNTEAPVTPKPTLKTTTLPKGK